MPCGRLAATQAASRGPSVHACHHITTSNTSCNNIRGSRVPLLRGRHSIRPGDAASISVAVDSWGNRNGRHSAEELHHRGIQRRAARDGGRRYQR